MPRPDPAAEPDLPVGWNRPLTIRQLQIIRMFANGMTVDQIGKRLYLTPDTVKSHLLRARNATGSTTRAAAIVACFRAGLIR